ncbi:hypothetical protein HanIR_Chr13g0641681 [Helianthus annuus]|nr:hypothetical protein HanIR_Chr13g0641681 [Helianthus annuus]
MKEKRWDDMGIRLASILSSISTNTFNTNKFQYPYFLSFVSNFNFNFEHLYKNYIELQQ